MTKARETNWRCWFGHKFSLRRFQRANGEVRYLLRCQRCPWLEITREDPRQRVRHGLCGCLCHAQLDIGIPDMVSKSQHEEAHHRGSAVPALRRPLVSPQAWPAPALCQMSQSLLGPTACGLQPSSVRPRLP